MADDQTFHDDIEGYCGQLSYLAGAAVGLHVSTRSSTFDVRVERWGATRETGVDRDRRAGVVHAAAARRRRRGVPMAGDAARSRSTSDWRSGFYLVTLTAHDAPAGRDVAHAGFVVRGAARRRRRGRVRCSCSATNTWNAYNTWGGRSLYTGGTQVSFGRPFGRGMLCRPEVERDDRKARPVRWGEEPDVDGADLPAVPDRARLSVGDRIGRLVHPRTPLRRVGRGCGLRVRLRRVVRSRRRPRRGPPTARRLRLVLSVGHDEYWSAGQRDAVEAHVRRGGNFASFSGNTMFWQVRLGTHEPAPTWSATSTPRTRPTRSSPQGQPEAMTGMWADPLVGRPEWTFLGGGSAFGLYHRFGRATARGVGGFVVYRDDHWLARRHRPRATATCSARSTAWSATRRSAAR